MKGRNKEKGGKTEAGHHAREGKIVALFQEEVWLGFVQVPGVSAMVNNRGSRG